ncbi:hypothetical protein, partial [Acidocella sp. MX-AZ02]|uniref:hypothetical protein n=1 Tax=Acidocella sp. MX-AZ02 TaxID=1214225 RepID=UPI001969B937
WKNPAFQGQISAEINSLGEIERTACFLCGNSYLNVAFESLKSAHLFRRQQTRRVSQSRP